MQLLKDVFPIDRVISYVNLSHFLPAVPHRFSSSTSSAFKAAAVGGIYGLIGRVIYPNSGIFPLHYVAWFAVAFQIKQLVLKMEKCFYHFVRMHSYSENIDHLHEDHLNFLDLIRLHCGKVIELRNTTLGAIDTIFCRTFGVCSYEKVSKENVKESSFLEMCRYRMWPIIKKTLLETISYAVAHRLCNHIGLILPERTALPLFLVIRSIVKDIILTPALHIYIRLCNHIGDQLEEDKSEMVSNYRIKLIQCFLPPLEIEFI